MTSLPLRYRETSPK